jgi:hypothetical protein
MRLIRIAGSRSARARARGTGVVMNSCTSNRAFVYKMGLYLVSDPAWAWQVDNAPRSRSGVVINSLDRRRSVRGFSEVQRRRTSRARSCPCMTTRSASRSAQQHDLQRSEVDHEGQLISRLARGRSIDSWHTTRSPPAPEPASEPHARRVEGGYQQNGRGGPSVSDLLLSRLTEG